MKKKQKIVVAVTGASGAIYAKILLDKLTMLKEQLKNVEVIFSEPAKEVWKYELENTDYKKLPFPVYYSGNLFAPSASGSAGYDSMIICPCTMGTLGRIASGISNDLITRSADVMLKERKRLVLLTREIPLNLIHIRNMATLTEAGGIICPASPSFYSKPKSLEEAIETVVDRALILTGFEVDSYRWGSNTDK
jgi:4-hydroxy-3-polyprenylbenzoate decarboxylase